MAAVARRELGTPGRLAALSGAVALLLVLGALLDGGEGEEIGPLRAADFIEAMSDAGIEGRPTGRTLFCGRVASHPAAVEHTRPGGSVWLQEWASVEERGTWIAFRAENQGYSRHGCASTCIEWVFWNANLVLISETAVECLTTPFNPAADPKLARVVEVFLALEAGR
jgi:hypothetical protein